MSTASVRRTSPLVLASVLGLLNGCALNDKLVALPNTDWKSSRNPDASDVVKPEDAGRAADSRFKDTPKPPDAPKPVSGEELAKQASSLFDGPAVTFSADGLPLPAFINEVFGNLLKTSFQIAPELQQKTDVVTLRLGEPVKPDDLFLTARQVLKTYGVAVEKQGNLYFFSQSRGDVGGEAPLLVTGETLPNVPISHRPVFQVLSLKAASANEISSWLKQAFDKQDRLSVIVDPYRNAIWLRGPVELVRQASEVVGLLDQPLMRGRNSIRIEPLFLPADRLAARLSDVLGAEGYSVTTKGNSAIVLLPISEANALLVFAQDRSALAHVKEWVEQLDKPAQQTESKGMFFYALRNTRADGIVGILTGGGVPQARPSNAGNNNGGAGQQSGAAATASTSGPAHGAFGNGTLTVDPNRNAILFQGPADTWAQLLPIVKQMDVPAKQVLIEVLVAEVSLTDGFKFGVEWAINNASLPDPAKFAAKSMTIGAGGLTYLPFNSAGNTRAVLNLLSTNNQASILQAPRVMVRSGENANISVGTAVPIVTSTISLPGSGSGGGNGLTTQNSVQYRNTGISLDVTPIIYEGGRVDLQISQEISSAEKGAVGEAQSNPRISQRSLTTKLSVNDGGSVLLGGVISNNQSNLNSKVPILGDLPLIGHLFGSEEKSNERTELLILIVPYVLNDGAEAESITKAFRQSLELHDPVGGAPKTQGEK